MTQTRDTFPIQIQLTAMSLPEGRHQRIGQSKTAVALMGEAAPSSLTREGCILAIYPGEPSELLVRLENQTADPITIEWQTRGDFPPQWCQVGGEGHQLPGHGRLEVVLYFQIAADFFEAPQGRPGGQPLQLDYRGQFTVSYSTTTTTQTYEQTAEFELLVRPRSLYLNFVPSLYRDVDFVGRFLKIFEQAFEPNVQMLNSLWAYLDPRTAPDALLPFLAHWVGWPLTSSLSLARQRRLIAGALQLYRWRGTKRGLRYAIHLFTDLPLEEGDRPAIEITELGGRGLVLGETRLGREAIVGGGQAYHFLVQLRPPDDFTVDPGLVRQVIEREKPAFCSYELYISEITDEHGSISGNGAM
ncbi:phage tail protein [Spirulina sp. CCNP1310]|uniref:phage tail protein n=1 Tax=Spirulina sp. CCNP1310 TaxID=3110249 RepID=UPI002B1FD54E|nr:phage tail protein [Spirulina sp. CCNP1310]MEA5419062.1 phage tail protein [Spirulina sp. CCNP1310]